MTCLPSLRGRLYLEFIRASFRDVNHTKTMCRIVSFFALFVLEIRYQMLPPTSVLLFKKNCGKLASHPTFIFGGTYRSSCYFTILQLSVNKNRFCVICWILLILFARCWWSLMYMTLLDIVFFFCFLEIKTNVCMYVCRFRLQRARLQQAFGCWS